MLEYIGFMLMESRNELHLRGCNSFLYPLYWQWKGGNGVKVFNLFCNGEQGQGLVEYGLILALVSVVAVGSLGGVGDKVAITMDAVNLSTGGGIYTEAEIDGLIRQEGYVPVATAEELDSIRNDTVQTFGEGSIWKGEYTSGLNGKYIQVSDIALYSLSNFVPIGTGANDSFRGVYDGGGYDINKLSIKRSKENYVGLFGHISESTIKNVGLRNVHVSGQHYVGGLVGRSFNTSSIINCYVDGQVAGEGNQVGGLVGLNQVSSNIKNSYFGGRVIGAGFVGGLVGENWGSLIHNSYAIGEVTGYSHYVGGLVGLNQSSSTVMNSYYKGRILGTGAQVGGLVGSNWDTSSIEHGYASSKVIGKEDVGGLIGQSGNRAIVDNSGWNTDEYSGKGIGKGTGDITGYTTPKINVIMNDLFK